MRVISARPIPPSIERVRDRFEASYRRGRPDECWPWIRHKSAKGYGQFAFKDLTWQANRIALHFDGRTPGEREYACHRCDNPECVNPAHLFVGSPSDNTRDSFAKGRSVRARGEDVPNAKLTEAAVLEIRAAKRGSVRAVADRHGVSVRTAWSVRARRSWRHVA